MHYISTRDKKIRFSASEAISRGLSRDGGLFVPELIPKLSETAIESMCGMTYQQRAVYVMSMFLEEYSVSELSDFASRAYSPKGFDTAEIAPLYKLDSDTFFLELWHGPTCAFKDMALQILPYFLTSALVKTGEKRQVCILVATSGDTGKAALEGFCDVDRTKIMVFFPKDGVSDIQKLQMTSQSGSNVSVYSVIGNFDDAQTGVKEIFSDENLREELSKKGYFLSSANSINWGRLLPQVIYYISAYCDLLTNGTVKKGEEVNFCVPTGNFGDILAGFYAKSMGLPVKKLICASNKNDVLTEFINTGVYNRNRDFYTTISPSMDILVSSNLERLLFELSGKDDELIAGYMKKLAQSGEYTVSGTISGAIKKDFVAGCCDDEGTKKVIKDVFDKFDYLMDTHTAVAYSVLKDYREMTGDITPSVVVSTASPFKFCDSVLSALGVEEKINGMALVDKLEEVSGKKAPAPLKALKHKSERFTKSTEMKDMKDVVREFLL